MASSKKRILSKLIIYIFLIIFPFGQLLRWNFVFADRNIVILALDGVAVFALLLTLFVKPPKPGVMKYLSGFLGILLLSWLFSFSLFEVKTVFFGGLYLLRVFSYTCFFILAWDLFNHNPSEKKRVLNMLLGVGFFSAIFGWIQYIFYPDLRPFTVWGWDDHLFRLTGTFLDPGFLSIILVLAFLIILYKYFNEKKNITINLLLFIFLLISIALTYSRAGYMALIACVIYTLVSFKRTKYILGGLIIFVIVMVLLPRPNSEGVNLLRTYSVNARIENYEETLRIWQKSPLLGVGYNNICEARIKYIGDDNPTSHSCSGSDSSLLLLLATTGILGVILFLALIISVAKFAGKNKYGSIFLSSLLAIVVHSLFVNSMFYPWVMGWMGILGGIVLSSKD